MVISGSIANIERESSDYGAAAGGGDINLRHQFLVRPRYHTAGADSAWI
jgi:hypothetical protein